ncbi:unnamed protein product [Phaedon cochleariae]|uniref:Uncharacterized protein n=1 Tax=Phaedon cochleariae TaxID=80249 RepID=A0A9P0DQU5_PHACE|nr:unnamed protein product [Phaedon cochleariae]
MYKIVTISFLSILVLTKCETPCEDSMECIETELTAHVDSLENSEDDGGIISVMSIPRQGKSVTHDENIVERCIRFLTEHELRIRIPSSEARSLMSESRTRKLRRLILPILLLLKLKAAIIFPLLLSAVALVAFKGLGVGVAALAIAAATALKSLLEGHHVHSPVSYELVPQGVQQWSRSSLEGSLIGSPLSMGYHTIS